MSQLYQPMTITGQTALVTGASAGIGEAIAYRLAEAGCKLILVARRLERLEKLKSELEEKYSVSVVILQVDVRDIATIEKLPQQLPPEFQEVDILVNNAGLALGVAAPHQQCLQDAIQMIDTNVTAVVAFTRVFTPGMVERNAGHVVNISSVAGQEAYAGGGVYCATKHALHAYTSAIRHDLVGTNIRVTTISPGAVKTEFSVVRFKGDTSAADAVYKGIVPLNAHDIADNVMYSLTRPAHVQIADILVYATYQSSAKGIARVLPE